MGELTWVLPRDSVGGYRYKERRDRLLDILCVRSARRGNEWS